MAKNKKGRKARKQANQNLKKLPVGQLMQKGEALLTTGNFRDAIKSLKLAHQKQPDNDRIRGLLVQAYTNREEQLRQKGLIKEAESLHHQVRQFRPDTEQMKVADLVLFLSTTDLNHAVSLYSRYLNHHPPVLEAEIVIAGSLFETADWETTAHLPENALIKPELALVQEAARVMDKADWESALDCLKPVKRGSPWSGVKLLCRAMVCFYQNDDTGMKRALSMIPKSFGRSPLIERLSTDPERLEPLWQGSILTEQQTRSLLETIKGNDFFGVGRIIKRLSTILSPKNPRQAIEQLLQMLWPLAASGRIYSDAFIDLAESILPEDPGSAFAAKFYFFEFEGYFQDTDDYLVALDQEFPDPGDRAIAESMVLSESVSWVFQQGVEMEAEDLLPQYPTYLSGITSDHPECILLEIIQKALERDPENMQARTLLTELPHTSRQAKKIAEASLQKMVDTFPDDPQPCLALARLNSEKNAFRKVEACLRQAEQRAPHDEQVRELHVLTLLQTVDINMHRKKYHLAKTDLEKAEKRCTRKMLPALKARLILYDLEQTGQISLFGGALQTGSQNRIRAIIDRHLTGLPQPDILTTLGILVMLRRDHPEDWNKAKNKVLDKLFNYQIKRVNRMTSETLREILLPKMDTLAIRVSRTIWLSIFLKRYKTILKWLDDKDVLPVLEIRIEAGRAGDCLQEIHSRRKTDSEPFRTLFEFYEMVIQCIIGDSSPDSDAFSELINRVSPQHIEIFRTAALRLSKWTWGSFREALRHFNFDLLDDVCNCPECTRRRLENDFDDYDDDFFDLFDEDIEEMGDPIQPVIEMVESFIDMTSMRGLDESSIKKQRKVLMNDYKAKTMLLEVAEIIPPFRSGDLSPEARILIFG